jgi:ribosomal protein RSM22 (predicted rRNA methylase)
MEPSSETGTVPCSLQYVASLVGGCPHESCPLWQPGGTVYAGHCVFDELNVPDRRTFESWLSELQLALERARTVDEQNALRQLFYRLLDEHHQR